MTYKREQKPRISKKQQAKINRFWDNDINPITGMIESRNLVSSTKIDATMFLMKDVNGTFRNMQV